MKTLQLTPDLYQYLLQINPFENLYLQKLREKTDELKYARLRSPTEQVHFITFLLQCFKPKKLLEIGTFTGYTTLAMALATAETSEIVTCDINAIFPDIGRDIWVSAGVAEKILLRLGLALQTLQQLREEGRVFDFIYIDADKENYVAYFELSLEMLTGQGVILVDNVLWKGQVTDDTNHLSSTLGIRHFNQYLFQRRDINYCVLPIGDGLTLVRKNVCQ